MAQMHEVSEVKAAIRTMITIWLAGGGLSMPYLSGVALEDNIMQLIRDLSGNPTESDPDVQ